MRKIIKILKASVFFACISFAEISSASARPAANVLQTLSARAAEYWKLKKSNNSKQRKFMAAGLFGLGWMQKGEAVKEVSPELEKEILQAIETVTPENFASLHDYAKKYSSHARIRNALMQKTVDIPQDKRLSHQQDALAISLMDCIDPACDPHTIIKWIVSIDREIRRSKELMIQGAFGKSFHKSLKQKGALKEAIRHAALQKKDFIFDGLTKEECKALVDDMELEDLIYFTMYNVFDETNYNKISICAGGELDFLHVIRKRHREPSWSDRPKADTGYSFLAYILKLDDRDRGCFSSSSPLNRFITDCFESENYWWLDTLLLRSDELLHEPDNKSNWERGLKRYVTQYNFNSIVHFIKHHSEKLSGEKPSWKIYDNLRMHKEVRDIALVRLKKSGQAEVMAFMKECQNLIREHAEFGDYIKSRITPAAPEEPQKS